MIIKKLPPKCHTAILTFHHTSVGNITSITKVRFKDKLELLSLNAHSLKNKTECWHGILQDAEPACWLLSHPLPINIWITMSQPRHRSSSQLYINAIYTKCIFWDNHINDTLERLPAILYMLKLMNTAQDMKFSHTNSARVLIKM